MFLQQESGGINNRRIMSILILSLCIVALILQIVRFKINPFIAFITTSLLRGLRWEFLLINWLILFRRVLEICWDLLR